ncbi:hypothetical protein QBC35DRAFT_127433 [Podospora australis]|uniref:Uncharacterized protein n=1 Tax=Podospora australis TaxID=1536484 RepID=A0AAN7AK77_9PEZI|nr:hypothetical protein QBC35DRAFT_127433 [Podospora australis]
MEVPVRHYASMHPRKPGLKSANMTSGCADRITNVLGLVRIATRAERKGNSQNGEQAEGTYYFSRERHLKLCHLVVMIRTFMTNGLPSLSVRLEVRSFQRGASLPVASQVSKRQESTKKDLLCPGCWRRYFIPHRSSDETRIPLSVGDVEFGLNARRKSPHFRGSHRIGESELGLNHWFPLVVEVKGAFALFWLSGFRLVCWRS